MPVDNSIWPIKGYSYLDLVRFYIKISDIESAMVFIDKAIFEVSIHPDEFPIERFKRWFDDYSTHFNETNKFEFLCEVIHQLAKINEFDKAIELLNQINPQSWKYNTDSKKGLQGYTVSFYNKSLEDISLNMFKKSKKESFELIHYDNNFGANKKIEFYSNFFYKIGFEESILIWQSYFKDDLVSFITATGANFFEDLDKNPEYMYLSNFANYTVTPLSNVLFAKSFEYLRFKTKPDEEKLNLLSQVIDIDDWRKISASI